MRKSSWFFIEEHVLETRMYIPRLYSSHTVNTCIRDLHVLLVHAKIKLTFYKTIEYKIDQLSKINHLGISQQIFWVHCAKSIFWISSRYPEMLHLSLHVHFNFMYITVCRPTPLALTHVMSRDFDLPAFNQTWSSFFNDNINRMMKEEVWKTILFKRLWRRRCMGLLKYSD